MGVMDKFLNYMKIGDNNEADDDGFYDDDEDFVDDDINEESEPEYDEPVKPVTHKFGVKNNVEKAPVNNTNVKKRVTMNEASVCTFKPKSFDEAREIVETLLQDKIIVLNFEGVDLTVSQRVLDIITGACMAINGNLQKISNFIFIATPASVDVSGDLQDNLTGVFDSI